jgi:hypothetical protein
VALSRTAFRQTLSVVPPGSKSVCFVLSSSADLTNYFSSSAARATATMQCWTRNSRLADEQSVPQTALTVLRYVGNRGSGLQTESVGDCVLHGQDRHGRGSVRFILICWVVLLLDALAELWRPRLVPWHGCWSTCLHTNTRWSLRQAADIV